MLRWWRASTVVYVSCLAVLMSGCVREHFYRQNAVVAGGAAVDPHSQDRFVPDPLKQSFDTFVHEPERFRLLPIANIAWRPTFKEATDDPTFDYTSTQYFLGFLELDEFGELWYRSVRQIAPGPGALKEDSVPSGDPTGDDVNSKDQLSHLVNLIRFAKQVSLANGGGGCVRVVLFVHGWKNNASDEANNVWGFRRLLYETAKSQAGGSTPCVSGTASSQEGNSVPVVGIYIGWRGAAMSPPILKEFTFPDRRDAASRLPGTDLLQALMRLGEESKANARELFSLPRLPALHPAPPPPPPITVADEGDGSPVMLIGHSFGALLLERAVTMPTAEALLTQLDPLLNDAPSKATLKTQGVGDSSGQQGPSPSEVTIHLPFDRVVFVNSAASATEAHQMIMLLKERKLHLERRVSSPSDPKAEKAESFLFLAITSTGDPATKIIMPIGESVFGRETRSYYPTPDLDYSKVPRLANQRTWELHSVANIAELQSHWFCSDDERLHAGCKCGTHSEHPLRLRMRFEEKQAHGYSCFRPIAGAWNDTPYWALQIPATIVPDHGNVFTSEFVDLVDDLSRGITVVH